MRGQSDVFDGRVPTVRERAVTAFGTGVVVVVLLYVLGREHAGDGPARRRRDTADIWPRRVERGSIERGGRRRVDVHVRDVVLERERGRVDGVVVWIGTDKMLSREDEQRSSRIEHGTVAGVRLQCDG